MKPGHLLVSALLLALIIVISCGKSNSKAKPKLSLESINKIVVPGDSLRALFKISNASGLNNGTFVAIRNRLNQTPLPPSDSVGLDTFANTLPNFNSSSGEIRFALFHDFLSQSTPINQNDTLIYKFFALTTDSVSTDTLKSDTIVIINQ
jgi:hypothetical protein